MFLVAAVLVSMASTKALDAQAPVTGATVAVKMMEAVDSSKDPAGKQYSASVTKAVDAGNGVTIPQGAVAAVTLANSGSGYAAQLVSVTINGQAVSMASGSASVTSATQGAAAGAVSSVGSMLGGFGHRVSAPSKVTAVAMGQRVVLPPGTNLAFVLSQPPAASASTSPTAPAAQTMTASATPAASATTSPTVPAAQTMTASAAPVPSPAASPSGASTGGPFISCSTSGGAGMVVYLTGIFQTTRPVKHLPNGWNVVDQSVLDHFYAYLTQNGYNFKPGSNSGCDVSPTEAAAEAAQHTRIYGSSGSCGYCGNKFVNTGWKDQ